jgi:hypothetical protein
MRLFLTILQCADFHTHGSVDGQPWQKYCSKEWLLAFKQARDTDVVVGDCWS